MVKIIIIKLIQTIKNHLNPHIELKEVVLLVRIVDHFQITQEDQIFQKIDIKYKKQLLTKAVLALSSQVIKTKNLMFQRKNSIKF